MSADLELLRRFFAASPFMVDLGVEPVAYEDDGKVVTRITLQPRHYQHTGHVHAGVTTALADQTMGAAAQAGLKPGQWVLTAELKVSLLRAAHGETLECVAAVIKSGRTLIFTEAEVWCLRGTDRQLVAKTSATMAVTDSVD